MTPPTWAPARQIWQLLRAARRLTRRVTGWPAGPDKFEAVLDAAARRGAHWISEEHPVVRVLATGTITAANLVGPLAGQPLSALLAELRSGNAYANVHTNDGLGDPNTGPGDFPGGEIRAQLVE